MKYPTIGDQQVVELAHHLAAGEPVAADAVCTWKGAGPAVELNALDAVLSAAEDDLRQLVGDRNLSRDKEPFEGRLASSVFPYLDAIPPEVLDDKGFWRYLAISRFWWFIEWREEGRLEGNLKPYVDARVPAEQIPLRLYLRAKAVAGDPHLCQSIPKSTDFWRSHVLRVRTGSSATIASAFARMQSEDRLATPDLREYARKLNRTWTNVTLHAYDDVEAMGLIQELRS